MSDLTADDEPVQPDGELLRLAVNGDRKAFDTFCIRTLPTLSRFALKKCRQFGVPEDRAQDLVQDVMLTMIMKLKEAPTSLSLGYLMVALEHRIIDHVRKPKHASTGVIPELVDNRRSETTYRDFADLLGRFECLSNAERDLIESIYLLNKTPSEIAKQRGLSKWAIYKQLERTLKKIRGS